MHACLSSKGQNRDNIYYSSLKDVSNQWSETFIYLLAWIVQHALILIKVVSMFVISLKIIWEVCMYLTLIKNKKEEADMNNKVQQNLPS